MRTSRYFYSLLFIWRFSTTYFFTNWSSYRPGEGGDPLQLFLFTSATRVGRFWSHIFQISLSMFVQCFCTWLPLFVVDNESGWVRLCDRVVEGTTNNRHGPRWPGHLSTVAGNGCQWDGPNCHASSIQTGVMDSTGRSSPLYSTAAGDGSGRSQTCRCPMTNQAWWLVPVSQLYTSRLTSQTQHLCFCSRWVPTRTAGYSTTWYANAVVVALSTKR